VSSLRSSVSDFRSSGIIVQDVEQADGRHDVAVQVNVVPVTAADEGHMDVVVAAAVGTFNEYVRTMEPAEIVEALRYAADQLEAAQG
jgi:hypothetical protein